MDVVNDGSSVERPRRIEILSGAERRRRWSDEAKARIVAESVVPGAMVSQVARRHDVLPSQIYAWRKAAREASCSHGRPSLCHGRGCRTLAARDQAEACRCGADHRDRGGPDCRSGQRWC